VVGENCSYWSFVYLCNTCTRTNSISLLVIKVIIGFNEFNDLRDQRCLHDGESCDVQSSQNRWPPFVEGSTIVYQHINPDGTASLYYHVMGEETKCLEVNKTPLGFRTMCTFETTSTTAIPRFTSVAGIQHGKDLRDNQSSPGAFNRTRSMHYGHECGEWTTRSCARSMAFLSSASSHSCHTVHATGARRLSSRHRKGTHGETCTCSGWRAQVGGKPTSRL